MDLMCGKVIAKGSKENVLEMFMDLEDYYDKNLLEEKEEADHYCITFEFCSRIDSFLAYDYFQGYSEGYECHIYAEIDGLTLEYNNGEIIRGLDAYGLGDF